MLKRPITAFATLVVLSGAAQAEFLCDFDDSDYFAMERHDALMAATIPHYGVNFGFSYFGSPDLHDRMRSAAAGLEIDPDRAPIVMADIDRGILHVFYCAASVCTPNEVMEHSINSCVLATGASRCLPYAVRSGDDLVCTIGVGLNFR